MKLYYILLAGLFMFSDEFPILSFDVHKDETILFYPTYGKYKSNSTVQVNVHGKIFEREEDSILRSGFVKILKQSIEINNDEEEKMFKKRVHYFLVDNQRWKSIRIKIGNKEFKLPTTKANGHFIDNYTLDINKDNIQIENNSIDYQAKLPTDDKRQFNGKVYIIPDQGVSLITDIDDTIKLSDVRNKKTLMRKSFVLPFEAVKGMSNLYSNLHSKGVVFHYVSASPWQLFEPLNEFFSGSGFPNGVYHMKYFRATDSDFFNLFTKPEKYKFETIEPIFKDFKNRKFILVGDSGEKDPEAYGELARKYPDQVLQIWIRKVYDENLEERFKSAFKNVPSSKLKIFTDPSEIDTSILNK